MRSINIIFTVLCMVFATSCMATQDGSSLKINNSVVAEKTLKNDVINSFPELRGHIEGIRAFNIENNTYNFIAVLTFDRSSGWRFYIFKRINNHRFQLDWESGKLDDSFYVTGPEELKIAHLDNEYMVTLEGCAAHLCPDSVFSILIYVPYEQTAFTAKYVWGKIIYSNNLSKFQHQKYKNILAQLVAQRLKEWQFHRP